MVCPGSSLTPRRSLPLHEVLERRVQDLPPYSVPQVLSKFPLGGGVSEAPAGYSTSHGVILGYSRGYRMVRLTTWSRDILALETPTSQPPSYRSLRYSIYSQERRRGAPGMRRLSRAYPLIVLKWQKKAVTAPDRVLSCISRTSLTAPTSYQYGIWSISYLVFHVQYYSPKS
jgi:hypothetical protein